MKLTNLIKGTNHCFIVDEIGIASSFTLIKDQLVSNFNHHVTIIYYTNESHFIFKKELVVLERLFPLQFIVFYEMTTASSNTSNSYNTEDLEAILNSNVMEDLKFTVSGNQSFVSMISKKLQFLEINQFDINELLFV